MEESRARPSELGRPLPLGVGEGYAAVLAHPLLRFWPKHLLSSAHQRFVSTADALAKTKTSS